jgi:hypothetical protein
VNFFNLVSDATKRIFVTPVVARAAAGSSAVVIGLSQYRNSLLCVRFDDLQVLLYANNL